MMVSRKCVGPNVQLQTEKITIRAKMITEMCVADLIFRINKKTIIFII